MKRQRMTRKGQLPVVLRIGHAARPQARWGIKGTGRRWVSTHGLVMAGSMPLLSLALYLGWQMAVPASEISAPARVTAPPAMNLDATGPARPAEGIAQVTTVLKPQAKPHAQGSAPVTLAAPARPGTIVNVESVTPVYSEPPLHHPQMRADEVVPALLPEGSAGEWVEEAVDDLDSETEWDDPR